MFPVEQSLIMESLIKFIRIRSIQEVCKKTRQITCVYCTFMIEQDENRDKILSNDDVCFLSNLHSTGIGMFLIKLQCKLLGMFLIKLQC